MKVLVVEDIPSTRRLLEEVLREMGYDVEAAADGDEAWQSYQRERQHFVVTDWLMPRMDGLDLCRRIRRMESGNRTFVLLQTGRSTAEDLLTALAAGIDDYIIKPISAELLRARMLIAEQRVHQHIECRQAIEEVQALSGSLSDMFEKVETGLNLARTDDERAALRRIGEHARRIGSVVQRLSGLLDPRSPMTTASAWSRQENR